MPPSTPEALSLSSVVPGPTRELVLGQLDAEINAYRAEEQAGGWTPWAVGGALLAVAALLLGAWERGGADATRVAFWCLAVSLAADALLAWLVPTARPVIGSLVDAHGVGRAWPGSFFRPRRPVYAAACVRYLSLAVTSFVTGIALDRVQPGLLFIFAAVTYLARAGQMAGWFNEAGSDVLIPDWTGRREGIAFFGGVQHRSYVPALLLTAEAAIVGWAYVLGAGGLPRPGVPLAADVKIGGLIAVGALLILLLIDLTHRPPLVRRLLDVRRRLALGQLDPPAAARELDDLVLGVEYDPAARRLAFDPEPFQPTTDPREPDLVQTSTTSDPLHNEVAPGVQGSSGALGA